ncbi:ABC transporter permease [Frisingicoccus sp.]|uniref:ABC transporter permease n=1 Tax=Frisingicoccus sp. TaxID=1918627 RepID=UPI0025B7E5A6|nr:ABC transporter permease [Frisingicoccus sp.]
MLKNNNGAVITHMAKRSLVSNKRRSVIMILAIALSAFMLFTILTVGGTWLQMQWVQNIRLNGGDFDAFIYGGFTEEQRKTCEKDSAVEEIGTEGFCAWAIRTEYDDTLHTTFVWADDTQWNTIHQPAIEQVRGTYPQKDNEVMTTQEALKDCGFEGLDVGDSFTITYMDNNGEHTKEFTISGMWDGYGDKKVFYVSKSFFDQSGFTLEDYGRGFLYLKFQSAIVTQRTQDDLEQSLNLGKKQRFLITGDTETSVQILFGLLGLICITCLSAYLLIYNILYLSVSGNVRYYGLLQTIGMTEKQVYRLVEKQMLFIGAIGIAAGMLAGVATSFGLIPAVVKTLGIREADISITFHPAIFLLTLLIAVLTIYIGSRKPAKMATQVTPIEALGYRPQAGRKLSHKTGKDNLLWRMAREQLCRDKKKTAMVVAALGICLSFFLCMVTLIESQGPRTIVSDYMDADMIINNDTMQMETQDKWKPLIDDAFLTELQQNQAIQEVHPIVNAQIVVPWEADFVDYWMDEFYDMWMGEEYADIKEDYQQHPEKYSSFLVGIDKQEFECLNATLEQPVDEADFLAGNACILYTNWLKLNQTKTIGKSISFYPDGQDDQMFQMTIQGTTEDTYYANLLGTPPTMIVSDRFVKGIVDRPYVSKVRVKYQEEYNETTENDIIGMIQMSPYQKDFSYESKIEAMKTVKEAQGNMLGIGIGIALVLAFIGMMNYLNASVGNIQSRQVELAVMESIGMTGKQVRRLLIREGLLYAGASLAVALTVGLGVTYVLYQSMNYRGVPFAVPVLPIAAAALGIVVLCVIIPLAAYHGMERKGSIVERIRGFE